MLSWPRGYNTHRRLLGDVIIYIVGAVMTRKNVDIICVVGQV